MRHDPSRSQASAWKTTCILLSLLLATGECRSQAAQPAPPARPCWHKAPTLSVMTGFIYEPLKPYTIQQWMENLGNRFDADRWVQGFKEVGASHVVFYDKWIDGLVFHDTKTTGFKTQRDFLREIAAACQRGGLPLVIYFNAISDGNPEFDQWSLLDRAGKPIVFGDRWPTRYQTLHSPFRQKCLEQVRELLGNYGPIDGIWHDIFHERFNTDSEWTANAYQKKFGEPFQQATRLEEFQVRTLAGYLDEADAIRRERRQDRCLFTSNGSGSQFLNGGPWTESVGSRLQYLFNEGHSFQNNEKLARMAWALPKPLDINLLLNRSWFTPLDDAAPAANYSNEQAIAATAIAICQGAGVNFALTPGHDGRFGEDLERAKAVGRWFQTVQPWVTDAQPAADAAIVAGPNANAATESLARAGVFTRWIARDQPLPACRAIVVPAGSQVDDTLAGRLRDYVTRGGTVLACGYSAALADLCGVRGKGDAALEKKLRGASVKVDSEYNDEFRGINLLDGEPTTAWASGGAPMPHWAEITLNEPGEAAKIELVSRNGPYQVADLDIELPNGNDWRTVKSVRDAKQRVILVTLDAATKTDRVRVKILRELFEGKDRQYADVASIRVLDRAGKDLASASLVPIRLVGAGFEGVSLSPTAAAVEPVKAEVLARFDNAKKWPAVVCRSLGAGKVFLATAAPSTVRGRDASFWDALCKAAFGEPTLAVSDAAARRFRFVLTQAGGAHVLHVIDAAAPAENYRPLPVEISLAAPRVGNPRKVTLAENGNAVAFSEKSGRLEFTVHPHPVATVVLK